MQISSKLPDVGLSIFAVMTRLAQEHGAINLSQGFPDFAVHPQLRALVSEAMSAGHNQYAPMPGLPELREAISTKVEALYRHHYEPENEITITSGATEAIFAALTAIVRPGDEVVVFEPAFDVYVPAIRLNGGIPVFIKMRPPDYRIDWDQVHHVLSPRTRALIVNTPHNPTGTVLTDDDLAALRRVVTDTGVFIVSDEVYEHIIFDGLKHLGVARYPDLAARSYVISSFGKTYHTTGWKVGYCLAPEELTRELRRIHQYLTFATSTPMQWAYARFLQQRERYLELPAFYQDKRDLFLRLLQGSRFTALPCRGTFFVMLDYRRASDEDDVAFARRLTVEHGVAAIPPSVFYHDRADHHVLRVCFAKHDETLEEAARRLCRI
jgi:methionine aminotransferase